MPQPLKDFIESTEKEFDEIADRQIFTLNTKKGTLKNTIIYDSIAQLLHRQTTQAYELGKQEGKTKLENKLEELAEKYGTDIDPVELAQEEGKQETLAMVMREIDKGIAIHSQLAKEWTGISLTDFTKQRINPHTEKVDALSTLKQKLSTNIK